MTGRTRTCSDAIQAGRLDKATEFHDAAALECPESLIRAQQRIVPRCTYHNANL